MLKNMLILVIFLAINGVHPVSGQNNLSPEIIPAGTNGNGYSKMHWYAFIGFSAMVQSLLEQGYSPDIRDDFGQTPLHVAVFRGKPETVAVLVRYGADVNAADKDGVTPLKLALNLGGRAEIIEILKSRGAK